MRPIPIFEGQIFLDALALARGRVERPYRAMYSSWLRGIVVRPELMLLPLDDHMVHRGDAVFETFKAVGGNIYNLNAHLDRLEASGAQMNLKAPVSRHELTDLTIQTARAGNCRDALIRIFLSRGPGSLSCKPSDAVGPHIYIVASDPPKPPADRFPNGATLCISAHPAKDPDFATVKSCNYILNAIMEQEADDAGADFCLALDRRGCVAECATESLGIVSSNNRLLFPKLDGILRGTTMLRAAELAQKLVAEQALDDVSFEDIPASFLNNAREIFVCGTSLNVLPIVKLNGRNVGNGLQNSHIAKRLNELLAQDILYNPIMHTKIFP